MKNSLYHLCPLWLLAIVLLTACSDGTERRLQLEELERQNRADSVMTNDSLARDLADYFDRHGTPNERMRAHYILGRTYADCGEAPQAIETFLDAAAAADTTAADCDYHTLGCVYSQMADVYRSQLLLNKEIEARNNASSCAFLAGEVLFAISDQKLSAGAYILLNKPDSAEIILKKVVQQYQDLGDNQEALQATTILMFIYMNDSAHVHELKELIDRYEAESNLFDEHHELHTNKRLFYSYKGKYFENVGRLDSAEHYYRKVYYPGMPYTSLNSMYEGLLGVFKKRHQSDSIAKYAQLYCAANDSSIAIKDQQLTAQLAAAYQYNHYQKKALENEQKAHRREIMLNYLVFAAIVIVASSIVWGKRYIKKQKEKREKLIKEKESKQKVVEQIQKELHSSEAKTRQYKEELTQAHGEKDVLEKKNDELQKEVADLKKNDTTFAWIEKSKLFKDTDIYKWVAYVAEHPSERLSEKEWALLISTFSEHYPVLFHDATLHQDKNKGLRLRICILTVMGFANNEQAGLLQTSKQTISNNMAALNKQLFEEKSARTLHDNLVNKYNIAL